MDVIELSPEGLRSFRLNQASLALARKDSPNASRLIARNIERMRESAAVAPAYVARCAELLQAGPDAMTVAFLALTDEGQVLRSVHPFAGLPPPSDRHDIIRQTRRGRAHDAA